MSKRSSEIPPAVTAAVPERGRFADEDATRAWGWGQGEGGGEVPYAPPVEHSAPPAPVRVRLAEGVEVLVDPHVLAAHPELVEALGDAAHDVLEVVRKLRIAAGK